jgi:hypothetical protein
MSLSTINDIRIFPGEFHKQEFDDNNQLIVSDYHAALFVPYHYGTRKCAANIDGQYYNADITFGHYCSMLTIDFLSRING